MIQIWWHEGQNTLDIVQPDGVTYAFYEDVGFWAPMRIENFSYYNNVCGWVMIGAL